jgi:hypothetical protein
LRLAAEKERKDREAARDAARAQEEQRVKLAAERERAQREEAQRLMAEQQRTRIASVDRKQPALAGLSSEIRNVPPTQAAPASSDPCERDGAMLAHLRSNPSLEAVMQFERSLTCEKLRAQALRLQESLSSLANAAAIAVPVAPPPAPPPAPRQEAAPKLPAVPPKVAVATLEPGPACKQDEARLSKIRANPSLSELAALERDLGCERLRPQIVRLRESLPKTEPNVDAKAEQPKAESRAAEPKAAEPKAAELKAVQPAVATAAPPTSPPVQAPGHPADAKQAQAPAPGGPVAQVRSCDEERAMLARLRASQSREDVVKFERELGCEQLRPQVVRLKESLGG